MALQRAIRLSGRVRLDLNTAMERHLCTDGQAMLAEPHALFAHGHTCTARCDAPSTGCHVYCVNTDANCSLTFIHSCSSFKVLSLVPLLLLRLSRLTYLQVLALLFITTALCMTTLVCLVVHCSSC